MQVKHPVKNVSTDDIAIASAMPLFDVVKQVFTLFQVAKKRTLSGIIFRIISKRTPLKKPDRQKPPGLSGQQDFFTGMRANGKK